VPGEVYVLHASVGWGPHTQSDGVAYIGSERASASHYIGARFSPAEIQRWHRHQRARDRERD
jgi:hypothetical protein